ncbi:MAG: phosphatase PAP2 family protein [Polyangiaceae bacterium]|nr:phosphatase PAP2 family protein [Polyangiaceae bacterium]
MLLAPLASRPSSALASLASFALVFGVARGARAQVPPPQPTPAPASPSGDVAAPRDDSARLDTPLATDSAGNIAPQATPPPRAARPGIIIPRPKPEQAPPTRIRFVAEPVSDGAILSLSIGTAALSEAILGTGEIVPQQPQSTSKLLSIDRGAITESPEQAWSTVSNIGLFGAIGFAALDPILSGFRSGPDAGVADAFIYGETIAVTWSVTNLAKIAFRRPRPSAYRQQQELYDQYGQTAAPAITDTDSALSFFSGHASITASVSATATYLAFARAPHSPRPWITLGVGALATTLTSVGRVRAGKHFPTDVIAGAMAGVGIGILVPHLHRSDDAKQRPVWVGVAPVSNGGGLSVNGAFLAARAFCGAAGAAPLLSGREGALRPRALAPCGASCGARPPRRCASTISLGAMGSPTRARSSPAQASRRGSIARDQRFGVARIHTWPKGSSICPERSP